MIYKIEFSYDGGATFVDISNSVLRDSVEVVEALYNENSLEPNINNATFLLSGNDSLLTYLQSDVDIICKISLSDDPIFTGIVSPSCRVNVAYSGIEPISIKAEDYTVSKLKRKFTQDTEYTEVAVCNPANPANSIIHKIAALAGVTIDPESVPTLLSTEYRFQASTDDTYYECLFKLLFEFGYVFYFNGSGEFAFYNLSSTPSNLEEITNELRNVVNDPNSNIVDQLSTTITRGAKDKITVSWQKREKLDNQVVYRDNASGSRSGKYWAYRPVTSKTTFPPTTNKDDIVYTTYSSSEGELLYVTDATISYILPGDPWITLYKPFVNHGDKCEFTFYNSDSGGYPHYICNLYIQGNAWISRGYDTASVELHNEILDEYEYECQYIYTKEDADNLLKILKNYFAYSATTYLATSYSYFPTGSYIRVIDEIHQGFIGHGRVRQIIRNKDGSFTYYVEGITPYVDTVVSTVKSEYRSTPAYITPEKLVEGTLPFATDQLDVGGGIIQDTDFISGTVAGFDAQADKLFLGAGNYNNTDTPFYADTGGKFSLKNKLSFDGTNLSVSGTINAGAGGLIGGANIGADYVQSSNYVVNTSGWKLNNTAGSIEVSNLIANGGTLKTLTVSGNLTIGAGGSIVGTGYSFGQSSATIGGCTIGTSTISATNLVLTSGAANAANITVGTGATAGGLNSAASGTDVVFWAGSTHANRATAAARILANGQSFFTSGTVGGFTLTSSTLTGGNLSLANTGNITAGTSNDVIRISADDASYRLWIGNATAASAPFRVTKAGVLTATSGSFTGTITTSNITATGGTIGGMTLNTTELKSTNFVTNTSGFKIDNTGFAEFNNINVRGNVNSTSGSVGGWLLTTDKLTSSATGSRITLDQGKARVSIYDSTGIEKIVMGYLSGLEKNSGIGTYGNTDYGFWVKPGNTVFVDGPMNLLNGDMTATDASFKVISGLTELLRLGTDTAVNGLHFYHTNGKLSLSNSGLDTLRLQSDNGYIAFGSGNASWAHFYTDRPNFYFDHAVHAQGGLQVYNTGYGLDGTGKAKVLSGTGSDSDIIYTKDSNNQLKERTIQNGVWTYNYNQNLNTIDSPTFANLTLSGGAPILYFTESDQADPTGRWRQVADGGQLSFRRRTAAGTWTGEAFSLTLSNIGVSVESGIGSDSNTVYIKDSNGKIKERTIPNVAWTNTQTVNTTSDVTFNKVITSRQGFSGTYNMSQVQAVYSMGGQFTIDAANNNFGTLYGIGYGYSSIGTEFLGGKLPLIGQGHQLLFCNNGITTAMVSLTSGNIKTSGYVNGKISPVTGTGSDTNTVYIKDTNEQIKERAIPGVAWTNTQAVNTSSDVQFKTLKLVNSAATPVTLDIENTGGNPAIRINYPQTGTGTGISVYNIGNYGITINNSSSADTGLYIYNSGQYGIDVVSGNGRAARLSSNTIALEVTGAVLVDGDITATGIEADSLTIGAGEAYPALGAGWNTILAGNGVFGQRGSIHDSNVTQDAFYTAIVPYLPDGGEMPINGCLITSTQNSYVLSRAIRTGTTITLQGIRHYNNSGNLGVQVSSIAIVSGSSSTILGVSISW